MSGSQRLVLVAIAVVIAVGAVIVIGSGGDEESSPSTQAAETSTQSGGATAEQETAKPAGPRVDRIKVKGGQPVGGPRKLQYKQGDTVRIVVTSDAPEEVHLHGYDLEQEVGPGQPARLRFKAKLEGIFEFELHGNGTKIGDVTVEPS